MLQYFPNITGSLQVTGSVLVSGSITATAGITISGSIDSASYAANADKLDNLDSTAFVFTSSYNVDSGSLSTRVTNLESTASVLTTASASFAVVSSSFSSTSQSLSNRVTNIEGNYATTGSNVFMGAQTVCANITSTGTIVAQTLNVQQVTSSVVYSSGSNVFGCSTSDVQQFTGSVRITGSLNTIGNACVTSICSPTFIGGTMSGTTIYGSTIACSPIGCFTTSCASAFVGGTISGTTIYGSTAICGAVICGGATTLTGALSGTSATFSSSVTATCFIRSGGTSSQYLMADGSVSTLTNPVTGTGTTNYIPKFTSSSAIGNSLLTDDAVELKYTGGDGFTAQGTTSGFLSIYGTGDNYLQFKDAGGATGGIQYNHTSDYMLFKVAGSERLRISSTGNVSIGNTNDTYKLDVTGTGRFSGDLLIQNTSTIARIDIEAPSANSKNVFFKSVGNADNSVRLAQNANTNDFIIQTGDGTVSPTTRLTIASTGAATFSSSVRSKGMSVDGTSGAGFLAQLDGNNTAANGAYFGFVNAANSRYFISQLDTNNDINYYYFNGSSWSSSIIKLSNNGAATFSSSVTAASGVFSQSAGQSLQVYQTSATNSTTAIIRQTGAGGNGGQDIGLLVDIQGANDLDNIANFRYYDGSTYTSRMVVKRGGNVGIGTSSPTYRFETLGTSVITAAFGRSDFGASNAMLIAMNGYRDVYKQAIGVVRTGDYDVGDMIFALNASANSTVVSASDERMRITSGGGLGVGTDTPVGNGLNLYGGSSNAAAILTIQSSTGGSGNSGLYFRPYQIPTQANANPAQAAILGIDDNYSAYLSFRTKTSGALANGMVERLTLTNAGNLQPGADNTYSFGSSSLRWSTIYAANGTIQTSDAREKKDIVDSDLGLDFVSKLRPVSFKWKVGQNTAVAEEDGIDENGNKKFKTVITPREGKRTHYGLIAQEVQELLDGKDFGGFIHDEDTDIKGLRYDQFVPLLIKAIQEISAQIEELKAKLA